MSAPLDTNTDNSLLPLIQIFSQTHEHLTTELEVFQIRNSAKFEI